MTVSNVTSAQALTGGAPDKAKTPEEAAKQFEAVLVRQFVDTMTESLFQSESGGAMKTQADAQRDALATALTDELVESGALRFRDLLLRQWGKDGLADAPADAEAAPSDTTVSTPDPRPASAPAPRDRPAPPASGDAHFDLLRRANGWNSTTGA